MDNKTRMGTKIQTLIKRLKDKYHTKEALKFDITNRNNLRALTEPEQLDKLVRSNKKIGKEGQYREGGKTKKLSARQMDMYKEKYNIGGRIKKYQQSDIVNVENPPMNYAKQDNAYLSGFGDQYAGEYTEPFSNPNKEMVDNMIMGTLLSGGLGVGARAAYGVGRGLYGIGKALSSGIKGAPKSKYDKLGSILEKNLKKIKPKQGESAEQTIQRAYNSTLKILQKENPEAGSKGIVDMFPHLFKNKFSKNDQGGRIRKGLYQQSGGIGGAAPGNLVIGENVDPNRSIYDFNSDPKAYLDHAKRLQDVSIDYSDPKYANFISSLTGLPIQTPEPLYNTDLRAQQNYANVQKSLNQGTTGQGGGIKKAAGKTTGKIVGGSKPKTTGYDKSVIGYILTPDGTVIPNTGIELLYGYDLIENKDSELGAIGELMPDINSFKGVTTGKDGQLVFDKTPAGQAAKKIYEEVGDNGFSLAYMQAKKNQDETVGKAITKDELYRYTDDTGLTDLYLPTHGSDYKHGTEHNDLLTRIDGEDFTNYINMGAPENYTQLAALQQDEADMIADVESTETDPVTDVITETEGDGTDAMTIEDIMNTGMTQGEKIGLATGAAGRLGGIAAALANRPGNYFNPYQGVTDRGDDRMREAVQQSRIGFEQTAADIKAQGNLARQVARDTSNSWPQRYAASLGAQNITDKGLIKNRTMFERLYGDLKGKQAQMQFKGDAMKAQAGLQLQDWRQRDKDSYLQGLATEAQNLTNFGASYANLKNMQQLRQQQLAILATMGSYFGVGGDNAVIPVYTGGKSEKKTKKKKTT